MFWATQTAWYESDPRGVTVRRNFARLRTHLGVIRLQTHAALQLDLSRSARRRGTGRRGLYRRWFGSRPRPPDAHSLRTPDRGQLHPCTTRSHLYYSHYSPHNPPSAPAALRRSPQPEQPAAGQGRRRDRVMAVREAALGQYRGTRVTYSYTQVPVGT